MTRITFYRTSDQNVRRFNFEGHAGYAEAGYDIVCAAISNLVFNTINSIEQFTEDAFKAEVNEKKATIEFVLTQNNPSQVTEVLLKSLVLGCVNVNNEYGNKYIKLNFKEV